MTLNLRKSLTIVAFSLGSVLAFGQQQSKTDSEVLFNHHWYIQAQGGVGYTLGEGNFSDLVSPAAALSVGYRFTPVWGVRLGGSGWQAKGVWVTPYTDYKFNFVQGNADLVVDLSNLFGGYRHDRFFDAYLFLGPGLNVRFKNGEAIELNNAGYEMALLWRSQKFSIDGRAGLGANFRLSDHVAINAEVNANMLTDKFNSKNADNSDWHFNALVGFTFSLGKTHKRVARTAAPTPTPSPAPPVAKEEPKPAEPAPEPQPEVTETAQVSPAELTENIFFSFDSAEISSSEKGKIDSIVKFLKENESATVEVCGYADAATGSASINMRLSQRRADAVAGMLISEGIAGDRIMVDYKGDSIQPFSQNELNRVVICVAKSR